MPCQPSLPIRTMKPPDDERRIGGQEGYSDSLRLTATVGCDTENTIRSTAFHMLPVEIPPSIYFSELGIEANVLV